MRSPKASWLQRNSGIVKSVAYWGGGNIHSNLSSHFGIFWCLLLVFKTHLKAHWAVNLGQSVHEVQFAGHISGTARQGMELEEIQRKSSIKNCGNDTFRQDRTSMFIYMPHPTNIFPVNIFSVVYFLILIIKLHITYISLSIIILANIYIGKYCICVSQTKYI